MNNYYIGLLSGTSIDSIDTAIVEINNNKLNIMATHSHEIPIHLKNTLNQIIINQHINLTQLGETNRHLGLVFADAVNTILKNNNVSADKITAIGFHGQTICHQPTPPYNFSQQLGCASTIAEKTGISVVTDFRQRDMINNGQGAPLAPLLHQQFFASNTSNRAIVNIGGISNITLLTDSQDSVISADLGPGNTLLDQWYVNHNPNSQHHFDYNSQWAASGTVYQPLLDKLLQDNYFLKPWPKSTGREYFNLNWLNNYLNTDKNIAPSNSQDIRNIQRTLLELTAKLIANTLLDYNKINYNAADERKITELYLCGGGAQNQFLFSRLSELLSPILVNKTDKLNIPADWVEAALFAWLAHCTWHKTKLNLKYITGSDKTATTLGCIYY